MKGFLFLSLVGAAIYGAVLISYDILPSDTAEGPQFAQRLGDPGERQLRSWGSDLPALTSSSSKATSASLAKPIATPRSAESSQATPAVAGGVADSDSQAKTTSAQAAYIPTESAKVTIAAKVHSRPYVSSPIVRFYPRGTALNVLDRQNGWVQVADPTSGDSGWMFEQYLIAGDERSVTQTVSETETSKALTELMQTKPIPGAKKRARTSRPGVRNPETAAAAGFDRRWERRVKRRGSFGLFFFGRFARAD